MDFMHNIIGIHFYRFSFHYSYILPDALVLLGNFLKTVRGMLVCSPTALIGLQRRDFACIQSILVNCNDGS